MHVDHTALDVTDLDASKRFYLDGLRFTVQREFVSDDGTENVFVGGDTGATIQLRSTSGTSTPPAGSGFDHVAVAVEDLATTFHDVVERTNCPVIQAPTDGHGTRIAFIQDPDGYRVELVER